MKTLFFLIICECFVFHPHLAAQSLNPYASITDPLAIARISGNDFAPLTMSCGVGFGYGQDSLNPGYSIYAQDTGAGIITHLFLTTRTPDSATSYRLFVDGKLFRECSARDFYSLPTDFMQPPLDTIIGEARVCDVQIPYHKGFKLLYKTPEFYTFYDYAWRPLDSSTILPNTDSHAGLAQEISRAETVYYNPKSLWQGIIGVDTTVTASLGATTDSTLLALRGPKIISKLRLLPSSYTSSLDSVWLDIYWDGALAPSFSTPLLALFGQTYDFRDHHSLPIDFTQDSGFEMRLPMPFEHSMRVAIRNESRQALTLRMHITSFPYTINPEEFGYLHAYFSETNPTQYHQPHPVLHIKGRGKYIGLLMGIPNLQRIQTYEGDATFTIDSNDANSFHYEGMEDYFDGAQYFSNGAFLSPFGGTNNPYASYYRWHYLDAMDFTKSFDFDFQHGVDNDCHEHYKTVAFWYQKPIPYWTDRDTIRPGELWHVMGTSYQSGESVTITLDTIALESFQVSSTGTFDREIRVPNLPEAFYHLRINGEEYPEAILVTHAPTIQINNKPKPLYLQTGDTIRFGGEGYTLKDSIIASIGGIHVPSQYAIDSSYHISGWLILLKLNDGNYRVSLTGQRSGEVTSTESVHITRTLIYDCEDRWDSASSLPGTSKYLNVADLYSYAWRHNAVLFFRPDSLAHEVTIRFFVPVADTFNVSTYLTRGKGYGNYDVLLDGVLLNQFIGYNTAGNLPPDSIPLGTHFFDSGYHSMTYRYMGHETASIDSILWADYIMLVPTTILPVSGVSQTIPASPSSIDVFPEPAHNRITLIFPSVSDGPISCSIVDLRGIELLHQVLLPSETGEYTSDISSLPVGTYWVRAGVGTKCQTKQFHVIR